MPPLSNLSSHRDGQTALGPDRVKRLDWNAFLSARESPRATCVLTDLDRLLTEKAGLRLLDDPASCLQRYGLLRALHPAGRNDFNA